MWSRSLLRDFRFLAGVIIGLGIAALLIVLRRADEHITQEPVMNSDTGDFRPQVDTTYTLLNALVENKIAEEKPVASENKASTSDDENISRETSKSDLHKAYGHVKTILFFIGYPRSRHSLLGSLLDAHPHMVISDELLAFTKWKSHQDKWAQGSIYDFYDIIFTASERAVLMGRRSHVFDGSVVNMTSSYAYFVPNEWQGKFDWYIQVIGDKSGAFTAGAMMKDNAIDAVHLLEKATGAKVKFIHVVRNPFDNIATMTLQHRDIKRRGGEHETKVIAPKILDEKISQYFYWAEGSNKAREYLPGSVIDIPSMEIVIHPAETLRQICAFLEITCSEDYIQDCAATVDPVPSITRDYVQWTEEQKMRVYERMNRFSFYEGYTFDN